MVLYDEEKIIKLRLSLCRDTRLHNIVLAAGLKAQESDWIRLLLTYLRHLITATGNNLDWHVETLTIDATLSTSSIA